VLTIRWYSYAIKKRGEKVKYQGRKKTKIVNNLMLCDNKYNIIGISDCIDGNHHDSFEIVENMQTMIDSLDKSFIDYHNTHLNADSGFDVKAFIAFIEKQKMIANIKQNKRNSKKKEQEYRYMSEYIYENRFKIEVVFSWLDTYKRVLVRFEYLAQNFKEWRQLAAAMINFRHIFN
jgi:transposase